MIEKPTVAEAVLFLVFQGAEKENILPEWFIDPDLKKIFEQVRDWKDTGGDDDYLAFALKHHTRCDVEKFFHIRDLCDQINVMDHNFEAYVRELKNEYENFSIPSVLSRWQFMNPPEALKEILQYADSYRERTSQKLKYDEPANFHLKYMDILDERASRKELDLPTGIEEIDNKIFGLHRGNILTVGAITGVGKSAISLNIASHLIEKGKRVLMFSTEMKTEDQWDRILSIRNAVPNRNLRKGEIIPYRNQVEEGIEFLYQKNNLFICPEAGPSVENIRTLVKKLSPDVLILDYLFLFEMPDGDRFDLRVGEFMRQVKNMSTDYNMASIVVSQLNRKVDVRPNQIPTLSDLKESGNIEQESSLVLLLYTDPKDMEMIKKGLKMDRVRMIADIVKNRFGELGAVHLIFDRPFLKFELDKDYYSNRR